MKFLKPLACAFLISCASTTVHAAANSWGESDSSWMISAEEKIEAKNYEAAIQDLKHIVADNPKDADAYNLLGYTHRKLKRYGEAEIYYQRALKIQPKHKGALEYLGELYVETNRLDKANEMLVRLNNACFIGCKEYKTLKEMIESKEAGVDISHHSDSSKKW